MSEPDADHVRTCVPAWSTPCAPRARRSATSSPRSTRRTRDAPAPSAAGRQGYPTHLSAWRQRQVDRLVAAREGRDEPALAATETDEINADLPRRARGWPWDRVVADADATVEALIAEVEAAADDDLADATGRRIDHGQRVRSTRSTHLRAGRRASRGARPACWSWPPRSTAIVDRGGWPLARGRLRPLQPRLLPRPRAAASTRRDRSSARRSPEQEELRTFAPQDDDLVALRDEIPSLAEG